MGAELEARIRAHFDAGELEQAATVALEGYGRELLGYLIATMRSEQDGADAFAELCEDLWRGLPAFGWHSSFRTWAYVLARNAAGQFRRLAHNQPHRRKPLSRVSELADRVRSQTLPYLRTEVKDRFAELRKSLSPDDQALLILRVNRQMSWKDVARVLGDVSDDDEGELSKVAARLRKRFQALKERLHELAEREGLLDDAGQQP